MAFGGKTKKPQAIRHKVRFVRTNGTTLTLGYTSEDVARERAAKAQRIPGIVRAEYVGQVPGWA